jgi:pilus assembly protein CpaB
MLLAGAFGLGVLCFVGAQYYLRSSLSDAQAKLAGSYKTRQVIVAGVDIPAGGVLSTDNLATRNIPERYLATTAMSPASLDSVSGQKIVVDLKAGDPIDRGALERADRAPLSTTVAHGERAITFPVDEISSISGMLVPGDMIDLLYTGPGNTTNSYGAQPENPASGSTGAPKELLHVRPLLQAVQVMATGKTTQKRVIRTATGSDQEVNMDFTTVTLKVNPAQAESVLMGQKLGQLTAVLRNPDDRHVPAPTVLDETTFKRVASAPAAGTGSYIEMYVGGFGSGAVRSRAEQESSKPQPLSVRIDGIAPATAAATAPTPSAIDVRSRLGITATPAKNTPALVPTTR